MCMYHLDGAGLQLTLLMVYEDYLLSFPHNDVEA